MIFVSLLVFIANIVKGGASAKCFGLLKISPRYFQH